MSTNPIQTHHHEWFHQSVFPVFAELQYYSIIIFYAVVDFSENSWERQLQAVQHVHTYITYNSWSSQHVNGINRFGNLYKKYRILQFCILTVRVLITVFRIIEKLHNFY